MRKARPYIPTLSPADRLATITVLDKETDEQVVINKADFDSDRHERLTEKPKKSSASTEDGAPARARAKK